MISTQEIKEAIKEIAQGTEKDEEYIKNIQEVFELNPWLLEKLTDEKLKTEYIRLLYNRECLNDNRFAESEKKHLLSKENEILGKMVLEIVLKYSKKSYPSEVKSDLEIFSLLCGKGWKERTGFSVDEKGVSWKGVHHYKAKPQEIVENYYFKQEEENEKRLAEKEKKIKAFEKIILEEKDVNNQFSSLNKLYKDEVERLGYIIESHEECSNLSGRIEKRKKFEDEIKEMKKELEEKKILIEKLEIKGKMAKLKEEIKKLKEQSSQIVAQIEVKK